MYVKQPYLLTVEALIVAMEHLQIFTFKLFMLFVVHGVISQSKKLPDSSPLLNCPTERIGKKCISKCCPFGQHLRRKACVPYAKIEQFSKLIVYDKNLQDTMKNVQDMFTIVPGKFAKEPKFRNTSTNKAEIGYMFRILETGDLKLDKPNVWQRLIDVPNQNFCLDYIIKKNGELTNFPYSFVVVATDGRKIVKKNEIYLAVARWISCIFLLLLLVVYSLLSELQNLSGLTLMNYVASLFMAFLLLAVIKLASYSKNTCVGLTCAIYYFFFAAFCWMNVMSFDIWWTFRGYAKARSIHRRGERHKLFMYCLYAYGLPLALTIFLYVVIVTNMKHIPAFITPQIGPQGCFLEGEVRWLYLYTPMLILIICNWMFYLMTAFNVWRLSRGTAVLDTAAAGTPAAHRSQMRRYMVYLKLSAVMGLSWLLEVVSYIFPEYDVWYVSDAYNMLLGLVIFLIFACKKKVFKKLYKRVTLNKISIPPESNSCSSTSSEETVALQVSSNPLGPNDFSYKIQSF